MPVWIVFRMTLRLAGLKDVSATYRGILCDVWGVLHNGVTVYDEAAQALQNYREQGGHVVLITNSPRRHIGVAVQLEEIGVGRGSYDAIVTSGDVTRNLIQNAPADIFHIGPERDFPLFEGLSVNLTDEENAQAIVCTGLFDDELEEPEDYRKRLSKLAKRNLPFICANPDLVVERGDRMVWCAGSLAKLYEEMGGETRVAGKPHAPIYALASKAIAEVVGCVLEKKDLLAIGDGMPTDVAGAEAFGSDLLYVSGGIHAMEYGGAENPDENALQAFLKNEGVDPTLWIPRLTW